MRTLGDREGTARSYELYGPDVYTLIQIVRMIRDAAQLRRVVLPLPDALYERIVTAEENLKKIV